MRNIPTPNLDANARGRDTERAKRNILAQDLLYDVKHDLTEPRIQAAIIYKGRSGR